MHDGSTIIEHDTFHHRGYLSRATKRAARPGLRSRYVDLLRVVPVRPCSQSLSAVLLDGTEASAQQLALNEGREQHRQDRYVWDFGRSNDTYFNGIPDGWTRVEGRRYPKYVKIEITPKDSALAEQLIVI